MPLQTGPEAHPVPFTVGTGSFLGAKQPGHGADHSPLSSAKTEWGGATPASHLCACTRMSWGDLYLSHAKLHTGIAILSFTLIMIGIAHGFLSVFVLEPASFTRLYQSAFSSFHGFHSLVSVTSYHQA